MQTVFFTLLKSDPAKWKTVHISAVASGKIPYQAFLIAKNSVLAYDENYPIVSSSVSAQHSGPAWIFTGLTAMSVERLQSELLQWDAETVSQCNLKDVAMFECEPETIGSVLSRIWRDQFESDEDPARARRDGSFRPLDDGDRLAVEELATDGFVEYDDANSCYVLTTKCIGNLVLGRALQRPRPLLECREHLAIQDMSRYELIMALTDGGWIWQKLPKDEPQRAALRYVIGADKVRCCPATTLCVIGRCDWSWVCDGSCSRAVAVCCGSACLRPCCCMLRMIS